ncbi:DUF1707 domain-containing protein [Mycobacterium sp. CBMA271]|uniref:DUF1707 SHOCT-like domain-containing protein n=1 Tax=unclassified Mycobacteroides TaxID=2618759 RepID=UPI0012DDCD69|nr:MULTISPECIES: DUF1707 domain-containing protein [unclassified Mycobacteroides]MUM17061.1 hypothetical protein [Mycobacteroides sp. CBMA 326]MUM23299.1 DUF1707 domain-containing protein [Mycobacteroides sp. CBMA 271]
MAGIRAKDSDRNDTCKLLDDALSDGQLSMEEHRERVASATTAATLAQLTSLVSDLQNAKSAANMPVLKLPGNNWRRRWYVPAALTTVLVLIGVLIGWGAYGNTSSPFDFTADPGAKPDGVAPIVMTPPRQMMSLGGLTGLFEQMRQKFGDTTGYELNIYGDYAMLTRPDPGEPRRTLRYTYRGGWDAPDDTTTGSNARVVDLGKFDVKTIIGILRGAPETLGIKASEVKNTYLFIKPSDDKTAPPDTVQIDISINSEFQNGSIYVNPDGSAIRTNYPSEH